MSEIKSRLSELHHVTVMLTRFPLPYAHGKLGDAVWAFPLVGALIAAAQIAIVWIGTALGLTPPLLAGLALLTGVLATGGLHEDGLADCADAMGAWEKERRLEIMRDSVIGSYGTLALILGFGLRWWALAALIQEQHGYVALVIAAITSRATMGILLSALPPARSDGLGHGAGRPSMRRAGCGVLIAAPIALILWPSAWIAVLVALGLSAAFIARTALRLIGGQTGDVLGASQVVCEIVALLAMVTARS